MKAVFLTKSMFTNYDDLNRFWMSILITVFSDILRLNNGLKWNLFKQIKQNKKVIVLKLELYFYKVKGSLIAYINTYVQFVFVWLLYYNNFTLLYTFTVMKVWLH